MAFTTRDRGFGPELLVTKHLERRQGRPAKSAGDEWPGVIDRSRLPMLLAEIGRLDRENPAHLQDMIAKALDNVIIRACNEALGG